eukprot:757250-Hanusia_phi.AAC.1
MDLSTGAVQGLPVKWRGVGKLLIMVVGRVVMDQWWGCGAAGDRRNGESEPTDGRATENEEGERSRDAGRRRGKKRKYGDPCVVREQWVVRESGTLR